MAFDPVLVGTTANDGTGDPLRTAFTRVNSNFGLAVEGPATATSGRVAVYDGATGKLLQDGIKAEADLVVGPAAATDGAVALYDSTTGKLLKDGPVPGAASGLATLDAASFLVQTMPYSGGANTNVTPRNEIWVGPPCTTTPRTIHSTARERIYFQLMSFARARRVTAVAVEVTTASTDMGATCRIGLYEVLPDGQQTLLVDAGNVAIDSTGVKEITGLNVAVAPGKLYSANTFLRPHNTVALPGMTSVSAYFSPETAGAANQTAFAQTSALAGSFYANFMHSDPNMPSNITNTGWVWQISTGRAIVVQLKLEV